MFLILIRHTESEKNINNQFSSEHDMESLTNRGQSEAHKLAQELDIFIKAKKLTCSNIYSAKSERAIETSKIISRKLNLTLQIEDSLRSTKPGLLSGKSEEEAIRSNPEYIKQLYLFRKGLFNAYDFTVAEGKEPKREFEKRVSNCVNKILLNSSENVKIIIAHRSSITSILLEFAKKYYNYPKDYSGYVELDLGHFSVLEREATNNWKFLKVNAPNLEI